MPQMYPIWWTSLFITITLIIMSMTSLNYFNKINSSNKMNYPTNFNFKCPNWKW